MQQIISYDTKKEPELNSDSISVIRLTNYKTNIRGRELPPASASVYLQKI